MKNSNDTIGNGTHDLLACSAVPQPTAPPRAPIIIPNIKINGVRNVLVGLYNVNVLSVSEGHAYLNRMVRDVFGATETRTDTVL